PESPDEDVLRRVTALIAAFGSDAMSSMLEGDWKGAVLDLRMHTAMLRDMLERKKGGERITREGWGSSDLDERVAIEDARRKMRAALKEIETAVARELRSHEYDSRLVDHQADAT